MKLAAGRAVIAALAVLTLLLASLLYRKSAECDRQRARIDTLYTQAKTWEQAVAHRRRQVDSLGTRLSGLTPSPIHKLYVDRLREKGLQNPVEDLIADLRGHPEIIPYPGVLGGVMGFYDWDRIRVLSEAWVYAPFNDGHVGGEALFGYVVDDGGSIKWQVLKSRMN